MTRMQGVRRLTAAIGISILGGMLAAPAQAQRVSLSDLQVQIQALQAQMANLTSNPCAPGSAMTGVDADGTPVCGRFEKAVASFRFGFTNGPAGIGSAVAEACPLWQNFVSLADGGGLSTLTVQGSLGTPRVCSDPAKVAEITAAMGAAAVGPVVSSSNTAVIECDGFNWAIANFCASQANGAPGAPQVELMVSPVGNPVPIACSCLGAADDVYVVRPCIGNQNWGGVGTDICNAPSQTIEVFAE